MLSAFLLRLLPLVTIERALAGSLDTLNVSNWSYGDVSYQQMFESILGVLVSGAPVVAGAVFIAGAFFFAISGAVGKEDFASKGKGLMIDALIGLAVAAGALAVVKTTGCLIWGC